jgi:hypothetical protein
MLCNRHVLKPVNNLYGVDTIMDFMFILFFFCKFCDNKARHLLDFKALMII